ncbi:MAG TPA: hypothetical protein VMI15_08555 [Burkholderiales bacterium]|nr:hypothetical protein [Burkholderiales bacterium]
MSRRLTNVTITLDGATLTRARVKAAERGMSLSRYAGEVLRKDLQWSEAYGAAYRKWRALKPIRFKGRMLTREEAHDRAGLRRR